jgi:hypothetical protein
MYWKTTDRRVRRRRSILLISFLININIHRSAILGFDVATNEITIGMTLPIWADLDIALDGDG